MAEFTEVMEQARRMCKAHRDCARCALYRVHTGGGCAFNYLSDGVSFDEVELKIHAWTKRLPEPVYPSWNEWYRENFPDAYYDGKRICPRIFGDGESCDSEHDCDKCRYRPIPANIAEKFGIKPKEG